MTVLFTRHVTPPLRALWGDRAIGQLPKELDRIGVERAVIICGRSVASADGLLDSVTDALGSRHAATFTRAAEHSPLPRVLEAARVLREARADAVIAVGGGSAVVTARAATIVAAEGDDVRSLATHSDADGRLISPRLDAVKIPNVVVATTPTTAYAKAGAAVRDPDTGDRLALFDPKARAGLVVFDPEFAATAPHTLTLSASLNVLSMAVDGLQAAGGDALAEALLTQALRDVASFAGQLNDDGTDSTARVRLMLAALMAGQGSDFVGTGIAQALSHTIGPRSTTSNGVVEAMLLPHTMRFNHDVTSQSLVTVGEAIGAAAKAAEVPDLLTAQLLALGTPIRLRDVGIDRAQFHEVIEHASADWSLTRVPKPADASALHAILEAAW